MNHLSHWRRRRDSPYSGADKLTCEAKRATKSSHASRGATNVAQNLSYRKIKSLAFARPLNWRRRRDSPYSGADKLACGEKRATKSSHASRGAINVAQNIFYAEEEITHFSEYLFAPQVSCQSSRHECLSFFSCKSLLQAKCLATKKQPYGLDCFGGEEEIRTLEPLLTVTRFPVARPRPN